LPPDVLPDAISWVSHSQDFMAIVVAVTGPDDWVGCAIGDRDALVVWTVISGTDPNRCHTARIVKSDLCWPAQGITGSHCLFANDIRDRQHLAAAVVKIIKG